MRILLAFVLVLTGASVAMAAPVEVKFDVETARAVLAAVQNPDLTRDQAVIVARLPGNQGLVRKEKSYGADTDVARLADALMAAAHGQPPPAGDRYHFDQVRRDAPAIAKALTDLTAPDAHTLDLVKQRLALFVPPRVHGEVAGYLILGGNSGGFAFGEPVFYLNLQMYPSAGVARVILAHELYHAVRGLAEPEPALTSKLEQCGRRYPAGKDMASLFDDLSNEGIASYVGDVLVLPQDGDPIAAKQRDHLDLNIQRVSRSATLLELSVHALTTRSALTYDDIYALDFYGDEILYALGYVMAKAIAEERGPAAVADLIDRPGGDLLLAYAGLKSYGGKNTPKLYPETLEWARKLQDCGAK